MRPPPAQPAAGGECYARCACGSMQRCAALRTAIHPAAVAQCAASAVLGAQQVPVWLGCTAAGMQGGREKRKHDGCLVGAEASQRRLHCCMRLSADSCATLSESQR